MADEPENETFYKIAGYEIVVNVFLNAPLRREEFRERFEDLEREARKQNAHAATIEVIRDIRQRLTDKT